MYRTPSLPLEGTDIAWNLMHASCQPARSLSRRTFTANIHVRTIAQELARDRQHQLRRNRCLYLTRQYRVLSSVMLYSILYFGFNTSRPASDLKSEVRVLKHTIVGKQMRMMHCYLIRCRCITLLQLLSYIWVLRNDWLRVWPLKQTMMSSFKTGPHCNF